MTATEVQLGELIHRSPVRRAGSAVLPILSMTMHQGLVDQADKFKKRVASLNTSQYRIVSENQLVVGFPIDEGVLSFQRLYDEAIVSPAYGIWDLTEMRAIFPPYLERFLRSPRALSFYASKLRGTTARRRSLPDDIFLTLRVPLPSVSEQRRISNILDRADVLRTKRRKAVSQLNILAESVFLDMFVYDNPSALETTIESVANAKLGGIRTGPFGSQLLHTEFVGEGISVLGIDNAVNNEFKWGKPRFITAEKYRMLKRYTVHPGDVLITIMGTCGRCAVVPEGIPVAINTKHLCCISLNRDKCLPGFLHAYFLLHPLARGYLIRTANGAVMDGLNMGIIRQMPLLLPSLDVQQQYVSRAEQIRNIRNAQMLSASDADALFNSLQDHAFRGEM